MKFAAQLEKQVTAKGKIPKKKPTTKLTLEQLEAYIKKHMAGNFAADAPLFTMVDGFILTHHKKNRDKAKEALKLLDLLMGTEPPKPEEEDQQFDEYMKEMKAYYS